MGQADHGRRIGLAFLGTVPIGPFVDSRDPQ
jgi:hypothetical protein